MVTRFFQQNHGQIEFDEFVPGYCSVYMTLDLPWRREPGGCLVASGGSLLVGRVVGACCGRTGSPA